MREFLFRGKTVPTEDCESEWIKGDLLSNAYPIPNIRPLGSACCYRVIPESVGQFTGLYDSTKWGDLSELEQQEWLKNHTKDQWKGKRVFEGDILSYHGVAVTGDYKSIAIEVLTVVKWSSKQLAWICDDPFHGETLLSDSLVTDNIISDCVVGNVHDNSELLESEE